ncbi:acetyltransferase [Xylanimonas sp. McL0601]|uniref:acetyltransferase n=1 Tax=Xylanimonas sp. McL0601 TaxID=3414739 RepID=UPI003CF375DE
MAAVLILGASGLAREVLPVLRELGRDVLGILDDRYATLPRTVGGAPVLGGIDDAGMYPDAEVLACVGPSKGRESVVARAERAGVTTWATVVDPSVRNPGASPVGQGSILLAGVTITADAVLGDHVVAMPRVSVTHDCLVADAATLAAGVTLGGGVRVGRAAYLGMNACVRPGVVIGAGATVGMGSVVLGDVPDDETWAGVPARQLGAHT